jgi:putative thioredoxin
MSNVPPSAASLRGAVDLSSLVNRPQAPSASGAAGTGAGAGSAGHPATGELHDDASAGTLPSLVFDVTDATFSAVLDLSNTVPVVVDIWAEWCGPCKQLSPILEKLVAEYAGRVVLAKVDADTNPQLTQAFQAQSIPTVAAVIGGRPVALFVGALPEAQVRDVFEQVLQLAEQNGVTGRVSVSKDDGSDEPAEPAPEPLPPHHQDAYDAIDRGDYAAAQEAYRIAIAQDPHDQLAVAGLAQVSLLSRLQGVTMADLRSRAAAAPDDLDAQLAVADLDVSGGHVDDAFDRVLTVFPTLDPAAKDIARTRLLEYFEIVGSDAPVVIAARRRLTMLLY